MAVGKAAAWWPAADREALPSRKGPEEPRRHPGGRRRTGGGSRNGGVASPRSMELVKLINQFGLWQRDGPASWWEAPDVPGGSREEAPPARATFENQPAVYGPSVTH